MNGDGRAGRRIGKAIDEDGDSDVDSALSFRYENDHIVLAFADPDGKLVKLRYGTSVNAADRPARVDAITDNGGSLVYVAYRYPGFDRDSNGTFRDNRFS
jgi:hypothetical protein